MIAAAATRGDVMVTNIIPKHMESLSAKLEEMGVGVEEYDEAIRIYVDKPELKRANAKNTAVSRFPNRLAASDAYLADCGKRNKHNERKRLG